jgi:hypothetical protein
MRNMGQERSGVSQRFGCEQCWPESADAAWEARRTLTCASDLIDESHFHVMTLACPTCAQQFLSVFTEQVDWADGEDPQYWAMLPISREEAADLFLRKDALTEDDLSRLGADRRSLWRDHPKRVPPSSYWGEGMSIRWHD